MQGAKIYEFEAVSIPSPVPHDCAWVNGQGALRERYLQADRLTRRQLFLKRRAQSSFAQVERASPKHCRAMLPLHDGRERSLNAVAGKAPY